MVTVRLALGLNWVSRTKAVGCTANGTPGVTVIVYPIEFSGDTCAGARSWLTQRALFGKASMQREELARWPPRSMNDDERQFGTSGRRHRHRTRARTEYTSEVTSVSPEV